MATLIKKYIYVKVVCLVIIAAVFNTAAPAQPYQFGKSYQDAEGWTGLMTGNMPLVISVPHGGTLNLDEVADRSCEGAVTVTDSYTRELAFEIAAVMEKFYGLKPYIVVCNISRKDIDQNREMETATCGNTGMEKPWNVFHDYIDTALAMATRGFGGALYIDLHGHGHELQRLELGYLLRESELKTAATAGETASTVTDKSSVANLIGRSSGSLALNQLLTGDRAFGTMMASEGFPSVPSRQDPFPQAGDKYFNGGYNTNRYTGADYPNVFGWQIESNMRGVRDAAGRPVFARAFCKVILNYMRENTSLQLPALKAAN